MSVKSHSATFESGKNKRTEYIQISSQKQKTFYTNCVHRKLENMFIKKDPECNPKCHSLYMFAGRVFLSTFGLL